MIFFKVRSRWDIIQDILKALFDEKKAKKTRIMQKAFLDWRNFRHYFEFLLAEGYISKNGKEYMLTKKGEKLLEKLNELNEMLMLIK